MSLGGTRPQEDLACERGRRGRGGQEPRRHNDLMSTRDRGFIVNRSEVYFPQNIAFFIALVVPTEVVLLLDLDKVIIFSWQVMFRRVTSVLSITLTRTHEENTYHYFPFIRVCAARNLDVMCLRHRPLQKLQVEMNQPNIAFGRAVKK